MPCHNNYTPHVPHERCETAVSPQSYAESLRLQGFVTSPLCHRDIHSHENATAESSSHPTMGPYVIYRSCVVVVASATWCATLRRRLAGLQLAIVDVAEARRHKGDYEVEDVQFKGNYVGARNATVPDVRYPLNHEESKAKQDPLSTYRCCSLILVHPLGKSSSLSTNHAITNTPLEESC